MVVQGDVVDPDDLEVHREGDRHQDGEYLPGLASLMDRPSPWDEFDDEPTHEKWLRGGKWRSH